VEGSGFVASAKQIRPLEGFLQARQPDRAPLGIDHHPYKALRLDDPALQRAL